MMGTLLSAGHRGRPGRGRGTSTAAPSRLAPQRWSAPQDRDHGCSCLLPSTRIGLHSLQGSKLSELQCSQNRARPRLPVGCVCDTFCGLVSRDD